MQERTVAITVCADCRSVIECDEWSGVPEADIADFRKRFEEGMKREIGDALATIVVLDGSDEPSFSSTPCVICRTPLAGDRFDAEIAYHGDSRVNPYFPYTPEHRVWVVAQEKGKAAASWVFDGNTPKADYAHVLTGILDGDPRVMDAYNPPNLSGEYADSYSEDDLMKDAGWVPHDGTDLRDALAMQFNQEADDAFWAELERMCNDQLNS
jgi:hypothetical protein